MGTIKLNKQVKNIEPELTKVSFTAKTEDEFVEDIKKLRTENETVYRCNNRITRKVIMATPTRYRDPNGELKEIKNTLNDNGKEIVNSESSYKIRFDKDAHSGKIFDLQKGKHFLTLSSVNFSGDRRRICGCTCELCVGKNNAVSATFDDGTQIQYEAMNDRIKENIIVKGRQDSYEFNFKLNIGNLTVEEGKHNDLLLKDAETGNTEFRIPAPFMFDANNKYSNKVRYEIDVNGEELEIKVVADAEFINSAERAFPVTIDPQIILLYGQAFSYTTIESSIYSSEDDEYDGRMQVYAESGDQISKHIDVSIFKSNINVNRPIDKAELVITAKPGAHGYFKVDGKLYAAEEKTYTIDITDLFTINNNYISFYITGDVDTHNNDKSQIEFYTSGENAAKLVLSYNERVVDTSKVNQTELKYNCGAGSASVNLFTGRMLFEYKDCGIGAGNYRIEVSHVYNSYFTEEDSLYNYKNNKSLTTNVGHGFKLNVQQYLLKGENNYVYIDGTGFRHNFKQIETNKYYDESGLGLILDLTTTDTIIKDDAGNKMFFDGNGRLIKKVSCYHSGMITYFDYDSLGRLEKIFDSRNAKNVIRFTYNGNNLLSSMSCAYDGSKMLTTTYEYDNNNLCLKKITNKAGSTVFVYDENKKLVLTVYEPDKSAIQFDYQELKINKVFEGVVQNDYATTKSLVNDNIKNRYIFTHNKMNTVVRSQHGLSQNDDKDLVVIYYFNDKGYTTSVLEEKGNEYNLKSMKKLPGVAVPLDESTTNYTKLSAKINCKPAYLFNDSKMIRIPLNQSAINYRQKKYINCTCYNLSFWFKLVSEEASSSFEVFTYSRYNNDVEETFKSYFDNTAINVWQYLTVPIELPFDDPRAFALNFSDNLTCQIADMRLSCATSTKYFCGVGSETIDLDKVESIRYKQSGTTYTKSIGSDCYISEKDLYSTFMSMYLNRPVGQRLNTSSNFYLSLCDGTEKILVSSVSLLSESKEFALQITKKQENNVSFGTASFYKETRSPDEKMITKEYTRFYPNLKIGSVYREVVGQFIEAEKTTSTGNKKTEARVYVDLKGQKLQEIDEYGVITTYSYDNYGNLNYKKVSHSGTTETLKYEAEIELSNDGSQISKKEDTDKTHTTGKYNALTGNLAEVNLTSDNTDTPVKFTYDNANRLTVASYLSSNSLEYDSCGRLHKINKDGKTWEVEYDKFNSPIKYKFNGNTISVKTPDYNNGTSETVNYVGSQNYSLKVKTDKYGRVQSTEEYDSRISQKPFITTYYPQELDDSKGTAEYSEGAAETDYFDDPYEKSEYCYTYDENNNLTSSVSRSRFYSPDNTVISNWVNIKKEGEDKVQYNVFETDRLKAETSEIVYDDDKILSPRIKKITNDYRSYENYDILREFDTSYTYDELGRTKNKKITSNYYNGITNSTDFAYISGTELVSNLGVTFDTVKFNFKYEYDSEGRITKYTTVKNGDEINCSNYTYSNGVLVSEESDNPIPNTAVTFTRNKYGYCNNYKGEQLEWVRGGLLNGCGGATYSYNSMGQRFLKDTEDYTTIYSYDGKKLLSEDLTRCEDGFRICYLSIVYIYDNDGIAGFYRTVRTQSGNSTRLYYFVKDALGNVISIIDGYNKKERARYTYDAWGRCKVENLNTEFEDYSSTKPVGEFNPIRWKGQYYDVESGLYYIDGRYYSPEAREYLNPLTPEEMFANADNPMVNAFKLTVTNPLAVGFVTYTADTFREMAYDPETMTDWQYFWNVKWKRFWNSPLGIVLAVELFVAAIAITVAASAVPCIGAGAWISFGVTFGLALGAFLISATVAGLRCAKAGGSFWDEVGNFITDNWSETLAITSALYIAETALMIAVSPNCFKEGTLVETEDGLKPIEEIQVGDKVLAYDEETGEQAYKPVLRLFRNTSQDWTGVTVNGEEIISTPKHKYYLPESKSWKSAEELEVGNKVLLSDGSYGTIDAVKAIRYDEPITTYNFEVADFHTYYVGAGVLVHNIGCGVELYRGGNDMTLKAGEYRLDANGMVKPTHGISVNADPSAVAKFGGAFKINSIPDGLQVIQRGRNLMHFEIVPQYAMPFSKYQNLLYQIPLTLV